MRCKPLICHYWLLDFKMNKAYIFTGMAALFFCNQASADLIYKPIDPSFGGDPFNSSHLMGLANSQNQFNKPKSSTTQTNTERFLSMLESRLYSSSCFGSRKCDFWRQRAAEWHDSFRQSAGLLPQYRHRDPAHRDRFLHRKDHEHRYPDSNAIVIWTSFLCLRSAFAEGLCFLAVSGSKAFKA